MGKLIVAEETRILPPYWEEAKVELMRRDRIMRKLIPQFGDLHLVSRGDPFLTLARSIIGQQISVKAAESIWQRLLEACPKCTPAQVVRAGDKLA
ncbi:MAG TPA: DNA-3-methyladenine glycosylase 2 family protein, partial [Oxalicibacterium sp.]|nr:DNA-3-methyladenine glycosylase 2 family protein [Oxalicibacterium sp.]